MSSKFKWIDGLAESTTLPKSTEKEVYNVDWNLCILCQQSTHEPLVCPAKKNGVGYTYVAENIEEFNIFDSHFQIIRRGTWIRKYTSDEKSIMAQQM